MKARLSVPAASCTALALLLGLVFLPNLMWLLRAEEPLPALQEGLFPALLGVGLLSTLFARLWVSAALLGPLTLLSLPEAWYVSVYGKPSDAHLLGILLESDPAEAMGFMQGLWTSMFLAVVSTLAVGLWTVWRLRKDNLQWPLRLRAIVFMGAIVGWMVLHVRLLIPLPADETLTTSVHADLVKVSLHDKLTGYEKSWPTGLPVRVFSAFQDRANLHRIRHELEDFRFGAALRRPIPEDVAPVIVVVIGETARPDRWQLYGYSRETTPRLSATRNLIRFTNVVTPWSATRRSVSVILTRKLPFDLAPFFNERSFISAFNEVGFRTAWLSNQNALGTHESPTSLYAHEANKVIFFNPSSYQNLGNLDDVLISGLAKYISEPQGEDRPGQKPQLIVLHTLGSHFNYTHRYPAAFENFVPARPADEGLSIHKQRHSVFLENAYDNSVLFTDYVLSGIIEQLNRSGRPAAMLYVADHGENFFDEGCELSGHGHETERDFRVPMLFWWSDKFSKLYQRQVEQVQRNANTPVSTEVIFDSLLDLAEITIPDEDLSQSVFSSRLAAKSRWVFAAGGINFDEARREPVCRKLIR